jgi:lipoprotein-anchoring transpeptidase ErfK/SrfK
MLTTITSVSSGLQRTGIRPLVHRRAFLFGAGSLALAGCTTTGPSHDLQPAAFQPAPDPHYTAMYAAMPEEQFPIPAVNVAAVNPIYLRQQVAYATDERPGTIIIDTNSRFLYAVEDQGRAMRYGIGVGREGLAWEGRATILHKAPWPRWTPTPNMIERDPKLAVHAAGMAPGLDNPLGARALYLFEGGRDTLYRVHGTNEPHSIGRAMSSGCIRLFNQDIIDLYDRTAIGTRVVVLEHSGTADFA